MKLGTRASILILKIKHFSFNRSHYRINHRNIKLYLTLTLTYIFAGVNYVKRMCLNIEVLIK